MQNLFRFWCALLVEFRFTNFQIHFNRHSLLLCKMLIDLKLIFRWIIEKYIIGLWIFRVDTYEANALNCWCARSDKMMTDRQENVQPTRTLWPSSWKCLENFITKLELFANERWMEKAFPYLDLWQNFTRGDAFHFSHLSSTSSIDPKKIIHYINIELNCC